MTRVRLSAQAVADLVGGRLLGDREVMLEELASLERADSTSLAFLVAPRYLPALERSRAGAVLVTEPLADAVRGTIPRIVVADAGVALRRIADVFHPEPAVAEGVDPTARIEAGVELGEAVVIGPYVVVGQQARIGARVRLEAGAVIGAGVIVGEDCVIGPHAVCHAGTSLGARVWLKAGAVIGGTGFGFLPAASGHQRLPHLGACVLGADVEVGSHSCIDRGTFDDTTIGPGTKIDNLVHIGHNVRMGARCLVMATTGIAGSATIGNDVIIAGGVGIADRALVGDAVTITAKSVVFGPGTIEPGSVVGGYPARNHREFLRGQAALYHLAPLVGRLEALARGVPASAASDA